MYKNNIRGRDGIIYYYHTQFISLYLLRLMFTRITFMFFISKITLFLRYFL